MILHHNASQVGNDFCQFSKIGNGEGSNWEFVLAVLLLELILESRLLFRTYPSSLEAMLVKSHLVERSLLSLERETRRSGWSRMEICPAFISLLRMVNELFYLIYWLPGLVTACCKIYLIRNYFNINIPLKHVATFPETSRVIFMSL